MLRLASLTSIFKNVAPLKAKKPETIAEMSAKLTAISSQLFINLDQLDNISVHADAPISHVQFANYYNNLSAKVTYQILSEQDIHKRTRLLEFWIGVCQTTFNNGDIVTASAIFAGIGNSAVERLGVTQSGLSSNAKKVFAQLREYLSTDADLLKELQADETRPLIMNLSPLKAELTKFYETVETKKTELNVLMPEIEEMYQQHFPDLYLAEASKTGLLKINNQINEVREQLQEITVANYQIESAIKMEIVKENDQDTLLRLEGALAKNQANQKTIKQYLKQLNEQRFKKLLAVTTTISLSRAALVSSHEQEHLKKLEDSFAKLKAMLEKTQNAIQSSKKYFESQQKKIEKNNQNSKKPFDEKLFAELSAMHIDDSNNYYHLSLSIEPRNNKLKPSQKFKLRGLVASNEIQLSKKLQRFIDKRNIVRRMQHCVAEIKQVFSDLEKAASLSEMKTVEKFINQFKDINIEDSIRNKIVNVQQVINRADDYLSYLKTLSMTKSKHSIQALKNIKNLLLEIQTLEKQLNYLDRKSLEGDTFKKLIPRLILEIPNDEVLEHANGCEDEMDLCVGLDNQSLFGNGSDTEYEVGSLLPNNDSGLSDELGSEVDIEISDLSETASISEPISPNDIFSLKESNPSSEVDQASINSSISSLIDPSNNTELDDCKEEILNSQNNAKTSSRVCDSQNKVIEICRMFGGSVKEEQVEGIWRKKSLRDLGDEDVRQQRSPKQCRGK